MKKIIPLVLISSLFSSVWGRQAPLISDIHIHGNARIATETITSRLPYKKDNSFDESKSGRALQAVHGIGAFESVVIEKEELDDQKVVLHVTVTEKPELESVTFTGNTSLSTEKLESVIGRATLKTMNYEQSQFLARSLIKEYKENDFHHVRITPAIAETETLDTKGRKKVSLTFTIDENKPSRIKNISFIGNKSVPGRVLRKYLRNQETWLFGPLSGAGQYSEEELSIDKEIIREVYQERGYLAAQVVKTDTTFYNDNTDIDIVHTLNEGPIFSIKSIDVTQDPDLPDHYLNRFLLLQPGDIFNKSKVREILKYYKEFYGDMGYIDVEVNPQMVPDMDTHSVAIFFLIKKGKKWKLNRIKITGNAITHDHVIRRQISLEEGMLVTQSAMDSSQNRVKALSYFDKEDGVVWKKHRISDELVDLELHVKEVHTREANLGIDLGPNKDSSESGLKFFTKLSLRNMFGRGLDSQMLLKISKLNINELSFMMHDPYLFNSNIDGLFSVSFNRKVYDQWKVVKTTPKEDILSAKISFGLPLPSLIDNRSKLFFEAGFERITNNNTTKIINGEKVYTLKIDDEYEHVIRSVLDKKLKSGSLEWLGLNIVRDTRNHPIYPNDGYRVALSSKWTPPGLNTTFQFVKTSLNASWYTPIIGRDTLVLGLHGSLGAVTATSSHGQIPGHELFFMGGQDTIRGFNYGQAGPSLYYASPLGGTKSLQINAELICPINGGIRAHLFYDAGCAWDTPHNENLPKRGIMNNSFNMRHAIGIGLNITQPQPIKLSFAYKLDRMKKRANESAHEFHIGMNTAF